MAALPLALAKLYKLYINLKEIKNIYFYLKAAGGML